MTYSLESIQENIDSRERAIRCNKCLKKFYRAVAFLGKYGLEIICTSMFAIGVILMHMALYAIFQDFMDVRISNFGLFDPNWRKYSREEIMNHIPQLFVGDFVVTILIAFLMSQYFHKKLFEIPRRFNQTSTVLDVIEKIGSFFVFHFVTFEILLLSKVRKNLPSILDMFQLIQSDMLQIQSDMLQSIQSIAEFDVESYKHSENLYQILAFGWPSCALIIGSIIIGLRSYFSQRPLSLKDYRVAFFQSIFISTVLCYSGIFYGLCSILLLAALACSVHFSQFEQTLNRWRQSVDDKLLKDNTKKLYWETLKGLETTNEFEGRVSILIMQYLME